MDSHTQDISQFAAVYAGPSPNAFDSAVRFGQPLSPQPYPQNHEAETKRLGFCPECGVAIKDPAKFCPECGSLLPEEFHSQKAAETQQDGNPMAPVYAGPGMM